MPPCKLPAEARGAQYAKVAAENKPLPPQFLIANTRLDLPVTRTKQTVGTVPNRKRLAFCDPNSPSQRAQSADDAQFIELTSGLVTGHSRLATSFLIYGAAIRTPRKPLKS